MKDWPKWIRQDEKLHAYLQKEVDELKKIEIGEGFERNARVNRILDEIEKSLRTAYKKIGLLFDEAPFALIATIENHEIKKMREELIKAARETFEDADYTDAVEVGVDYERFLWALHGAHYKLQEFRLSHPKPKRGERRSEYGKRALALRAVLLDKSLGKAGLTKEKREKAIDVVFSIAGHQVPSESSIKRAKQRQKEFMAKPFGVINT